MIQSLNKDLSSILNFTFNFFRIYLKIIYILYIKSSITFIKVDIDFISIEISNLYKTTINTIVIEI